VDSFVILYSKLAYQSLTETKFNTIIKDLLTQKGYKVEVYIQVPQQPNQWTIERSASPGNLQDFEEIILEGGDAGNDTSVVISVRVTTSQNQNV
jgi:hypothetical protein